MVAEEFEWENSYIIFDEKSNSNKNIKRKLVGNDQIDRPLMLFKIILIPGSCQSLSPGLYF